MTTAVKVGLLVLGLGSVAVFVLVFIAVGPVLEGVSLFTVLFMYVMYTVGYYWHKVLDTRPQQNIWKVIDALTAMVLIPLAGTYLVRLVLLFAVDSGWIPSRVRDRMEGILLVILVISGVFFILGYEVYKKSSNESSK